MDERQLYKYMGSAGLGSRKLTRPDSYRSRESLTCLLMIARPKPLVLVLRFCGA